MVAPIAASGSPGRDCRIRAECALKLTSSAASISSTLCVKSFEDWVLLAIPRGHHIWMFFAETRLNPVAVEQIEEGAGIGVKNLLHDLDDIPLVIRITPREAPRNRG